MALRIRSRPDYDPAVRLRPVGDTFMSRLGPAAFDDEEEMTEIGHELSPTSLPILATASDAREVVRYLRKRPNGVTVVEALNAEPRRIFDARKIAAYEFWGLVRRENERLSLTDLGLELAKAIEPESRAHREVLQAVPAYKIALRSIYEEGLDIATHLDVIRIWSELNTAAPSRDGNHQDLEAAAVSFFSLCHAAELGTSTVGKRGQPARLRVDIEQVRIFLSEPASPVAAFPARQRPDPAGFLRQAADANSIRQVLVSTSGPISSVNPLNSLLSIAGFENRTLVIDADPENGLIPGNELSEIQQCQAAIFVISPNDCLGDDSGSYSLRPEWITKISVAAALFGWRVLLFWNGPFPPPSELAASGLNIVSSENLDWEASVEIVNHLKDL